MTKRPVLSEELRASLEELGRQLGRLQTDAGILDEVLAGLVQLSPAVIASAEAEIVEAARLYHRQDVRPWWQPFRGRTELELFHADPRLAYVLMFHRDGRIREAALNSVTRPLSSSFLFTAVAVRLNDWVEQVRVSAQRCAERTFPITAPAVVAEAAVFLLTRKLAWGRWTSSPEVLDASFGRDDVAARLAEIIAATVTGPMRAVLRHALAAPAFDRHLPMLAESARQPMVRAVALQSMIEGRARWIVGFERRWLDKSMGLFEPAPAPVFEERPLSCGLNHTALWRLVANDRSPIVRRAALDGFIRVRTRRRFAPNPVLSRMTSDRDRGVRERAVWLLEQASA